MPVDPAVHIDITPPVVEDSIDDAHDEAIDLEELAGTVQLGVERQTEVLSTKLEPFLSTPPAPVTDPLLNQLMQQVTEIRAELARLNSLILVTTQSNRQRPELTQNPETTADHDVTDVVPLTEEPKPDALPVLERKHRIVNKI